MKIRLKMWNSVSESRQLMHLLVKELQRTNFVSDYFIDEEDGYILFTTSSNLGFLIYSFATVVYEKEESERMCMYYFTSDFYKILEK